MDESSKNEARCRSCGATVSAFAEQCPECGELHPIDDFVGRVIRGNIKIESVLGSGGMGTVYRGVETHLDRPVAVKILNATYLTREQSVPYFNREAKVLSRLRHPNLVSVLDFGQENDGTLYLVLEYIPGKLLFDVIHKGDILPIERALRIIAQVLGALSEAHRHGVVHRDLKPGNVMIEEMSGGEDFVKVLDFGIAKFLEGEHRPSWARVSADGALTMAGMPVGTPEFMSPEQAKGLPLDARSDIYGAGIMLYEMLSRQVPFEGESVVTLLVRKVTEEIPPPSLLRPSVPPAVDELVLKAVALDPDDRFSSAEEFRDACLACVRELRRAPGPPDGGPKPQPPSAPAVGSFYERAQQIRFKTGGRLEEAKPGQAAPQAQIFHEATRAHDIADLVAEQGPSGFGPASSAHANIDPLPLSEDGPTNVADFAGVHDLEEDDDELTAIKDLPSLDEIDISRKAPSAASMDPAMDMMMPPQSADATPTAHTVEPITNELPSVAPPRRTRTNEFTVMIVLPIVVEDSKNRSAQLNALGNFVTEFVAESGGTVIPVKIAAVQVLFETARGQSSLVRAAEAALRLRAAATRKFPFVRLKIGLDRGELNRDQSVSGASVSEAANRAIALARHATGSQILASEEHADALKKVFQLEWGDYGVEIVHLHEFRGELNEPTHDRSMTTDIAAASVGLMGRRDVRLRLDAAVKKVALAETGAAILLHGPSGMGKTHLVNYVRRLAQDSGLPFLEARGNPEVIDRPMRPLLDIAILAAGASVDDDFTGQITGSRIDVNALTNGLELLGLDSDEVDIIVKQFGAGTVHDPSMPDLAKGERLQQWRLARAMNTYSGRERRRVFGSAMRSLLQRLTGAGGAVVVLEDVDLADVNTVNALSSLVRVTRASPLLFICTSQTTKIPGLGDAEAIEVGPIPQAETDKFFRALVVSTGKSEPPGSERALRLSGGSPLYMARWLEAPVETPSHDINLLLTAQVAELPQRIWRLIIIAGLLGIYFEESVFQGLFPNVKIRSVLEGAAMMGYFEKAPLTPELWRFRNPLIRNAALLGLDKKDKIRCHKNIFRALQRSGVLMSRRKILLEAFHASEAELGEPAFELAEKLGDRFAVAGDARAAARWYRRSLEALARMVAERANVSQADAVELALKLAEVELKSGNTKSAADVLDRLHPKREELRLRVAALRARIHLAAHEPREALAAIEGAIALADPSSAVGLELMFLRAEHAARAKKTERAVEILYEAQRALDDLTEVPPSVKHLRWLIPVVYGELAIDLRRLDHAVQALKLGFRRAYNARDPVGVVDSLRSMKYCMAQPKYAKELVQKAERALKSSKWKLRPTQKLEILRSIAAGHKALGNLNDAREALRTALGLANVMGWESARQKIESSIAKLS